MQFNVDKRFIEILNTSGARITWDQFRKANDLRRAERNSDPVAVAKKSKARLQEIKDLAAIGVPISLGTANDYPSDVQP
ncbi:hypothetical protein RCH06_001939 [Polaromonas sp. CG_9.5]|uniref:hypothetical protein n=1 Tax=Polaromonas sp. CG_9.5 TaxID=3071705 RepID=UPI002DFE638F|nr:hypothetical protein [Polaromonas sp. CG_9.5]